VELTAPAAGLPAASLDELLEAVDVARDASLLHAEGIADLLDGALGP
jgi:hypothetical protein